MAKKRWSDLSGPAQAVIMGAAALEAALLVAAQRDITRRPAAQIRGGKLLWRLASMVSFAGPIAYFTRGRKPGTTTPAAQPHSIR
ncbi:MAG: hypothetical protein ABI382_06240 [Nakamurella sp.]